MNLGKKPKIAKTFKSGDYEGILGKPSFKRNVRMEKYRRHCYSDLQSHRFLNRLQTRVDIQLEKDGGDMIVNSLS